MTEKIEKNCGNCDYGEKSASEQDKIVVCKRFPPKSLVIPSQNPITGQMAVTVHNIFPQLDKTEKCGEWLNVKC